MSKELATKLIIQINGLMVDTALTGKKAELIYFGSAEWSQVNDLLAMGFAEKIGDKGCLMILGVRVIRTVESAHLEIY